MAMTTMPKTVREENRKLKLEFARAGLDPSAVCEPIPEDLARENCYLRQLLVWVRAYGDCPDRRELERRGYRFPPVDPDIDPDTDWLRFERWLRGEPLSWNFVRECGALPDPATLDDRQVAVELDRVTDLLVKRAVCVDLFGDVPDRVVYAWLRQELEKTSFEVTAPGTRCHIGCAAYCPGCFQRPWCEIGHELSWPEDRAEPLSL